MDAVVTTYLLYLAISVCLTVWVGRTLHRNGKVFLVDVFGGNEQVASSVNHLLVVGFYLVNLGYVALALRTDEVVTGVQGSIEVLSVQVGGVLLVLGLVHFANLVVFSRIRRRGRLDAAPRPPVAPVGWTPTVSPWAPQGPHAQQGPHAPQGPPAPASPGPPVPPGHGR